MSSNPIIFDLPTELLDYVLSFLDYRSMLGLRLSCRAGMCTIPASTVAGARSQLASSLLSCERSDHAARSAMYEHILVWASLVSAQQQQRMHLGGVGPTTATSAVANSVMRAEQLPCYVCLQLLPRECFARTQCMGRRSLGHADAGRRFCMRCAVRKGMWAVGTTVRDENGWIVLCAACRVVKRVDKGSHRVKRTCCSDCWEVNEKEEKKAVKSRVGEASDVQVLSTTSTLLSMRPEPSTSERSGRCQRCWAIDHTERPAVKSEGSQPLCSSCWAARRE